LDGGSDGQGHGDQRQLGPAHLARPRAGAAPGPAGQVSNDKAFADKLRKIVGLYVDPPAHAVVLSVDEKSQIQALDRTQPGLPMKTTNFSTTLRARAREGRR
jgi:hypothetical protein